MTEGLERAIEVSRASYGGDHPPNRFRTVIAFNVIILLGLSGFSRAKRVITLLWGF